MCQTPRVAVRRTVPLSLQIDHPRSEDTIPFTLYDPSQPTSVHELQPPLGPPAGGTAVEVHGDNFAYGVACFFGETRVATTFMSVSRVRCASPLACSPAPLVPAHHSRSHPLTCTPRSPFRRAGALPVVRLHRAAAAALVV